MVVQAQHRCCWLHWLLVVEEDRFEQLHWVLGVVEHSHQIQVGAGSCHIQNWGSYFDEFYAKAVYQELDGGLPVL